MVKRKVPVNNFAWSNITQKMQKINTSFDATQMHKIKS